MARPHADQLSMLHPHPRPPSAGDSPGAAVLPHSGAGVSRERQPPERESRSLRLPEAGTWSQHSVIPATPFRSNGHSPESLGEAERGGAGLPSAVCRHSEAGPSPKESPHLQLLLPQGAAPPAGAFFAHPQRSAPRADSRGACGFPFTCIQNTWLICLYYKTLNISDIMKHTASHWVWVIETKITKRQQLHVFPEGPLGSIPLEFLSGRRLRQTVSAPTRK